jgi:endonuclease YncB( thermonuclease family)
VTEADLLYNVKATLVAVTDGDTIDTEVRLPFGFKVARAGSFKLGTFRLYGINAPETKRPAGLTDEAWAIEKAKGEAAKARLVALLPVGSTVYIQSKKPDKYGRWLGVVWLRIEDFLDEPKSINAQMLVEGLAAANAYGNEPLKVTA